MRTVRFTASSLAAVVLLLALGGCSRVQVDLPDGFAEQRERGLYRAVSPEGMRLEIRTTKNHPRKDLDFWSRALKNHLLEEGYTLVTDGESFEAGAGQGVLYEWGAPYRNESYIYLTAVVVSGGRIAVAEGAGEHTVYRSYREEILESLGTLELRGGLW